MMHSRSEAPQNGPVRKGFLTAREKFDVPIRTQRQRVHIGDGASGRRCAIRARACIAMRARARVFAWHTPCCQKQRAVLSTHPVRHRNGPRRSASRKEFIMNHRASGTSDRGHDRWRGDHQRGSSNRGGSPMRPPSGQSQSRDDHYRSQSYSEQSGRRYGAPMRDEDWPDPTHDYARGGYGGDYDRSDDERYASGYGDEGNYPGVGNYQDVGGQPGGGYAGGGGFEDR